MTSAALKSLPAEHPVILGLEDVRVHYPMGKDWLGRPKALAHALNGIDLQVRAGETLGVVGESGCGKSTLAQLLMGLIKPTSGKLEWIYNNAKERSSNVQIVFQDPQSSLDPRLPVWKVITEPLFVQRSAPRRAMRDIAAKVASQVGIRTEYMDRFPISFLAARGSVLRLPEPCRRTRTSSSSTSRPRRWTSRCRRRSSTCWPSCNAVAT